MSDPLLPLQAKIDALEKKLEAMQRQVNTRRQPVMWDATGQRVAVIDETGRRLAQFSWDNPSAAKLTLFRSDGTPAHDL